jgi:hypothetical protein
LGACDMDDFYRNINSIGYTFKSVEAMNSFIEALQELTDLYVLSIQVFNSDDVGDYSDYKEDE